jgi:hypothetical protein
MGEVARPQRLGVAWGYWRGGYPGRLATSVASWVVEAEAAGNTAPAPIIIISSSSSSCIGGRRHPRDPEVTGEGWSGLPALALVVLLALVLASPGDRLALARTGARREAAREVARVG